MGHGREQAKQSPNRERPATMPSPLVERAKVEVMKKVHVYVSPQPVVLFMLLQFESRDLIAMHFIGTVRET